ncbi:MAG: PAS domain S-box protein, partial [Planctomycetota bacterium]
MKQLVFLSASHSIRGPMATAFARARAGADLRVSGVAVDSAGKIHPMARQVMDEAGISLSEPLPRALSGLPWPEIDVVVALDRAVAETCPLYLPGQPPQVRWEIPDPADPTGGLQPGLEAFRLCRDKIRSQVDEFFSGGYMDTLIHSRNKVQLILDSLSEGIMVHDLHRKVVFFNRMAEEITGFSRNEVVGRDCHHAFSDRFCSQHCAFHTLHVPSFDRKTYLIRFHNRSGEERELEISTRSVFDDYQSMAGVLISFRDLTRENTLARRLNEIEQFRGIISRDFQMQNVFDLIRNVADSNVPVLIQGESG